VSGHPLDAHKDKLASRSMNIVQLKEALKPGMACVVMGLVEDLRPILTKGGDQMAFVKIADDSGSLEAVVFPKLYAKEKTIVTADNVIALKGRLNSRNGELSMVVEAVKQL
jgi:DNA polymerase-3 subunit alpha